MIFFLLGCAIFLPCYWNKQVRHLAITYWVIPENIHTIPRTAFLNWNSEGKYWGVGMQGVWTGDLKAWMDTCITEIRRPSRNLHREQTSVFLENGYLMALIINYWFPKKAQINDTVYDCRSRIEDKHQSIRHAFVFICRRKLTKCVLYFKLQRPWCYKTSFSLLSKQPDRPIRLAQCCTQFKPFGNKTFCFRNFHII